jgi:hypothetical protein
MSSKKQPQPSAPPNRRRRRFCSNSPSQSIFKALITPTEDEEAAYAAVFGESGDVDEEYRAYQSYYGVDPKNRE